MIANYLKIRNQSEFSRIRGADVDQAMKNRIEMVITFSRKQVEGRLLMIGPGHSPR